MRGQMSGGQISAGRSPRFSVSARFALGPPGGASLSSKTPVLRAQFRRLFFRSAARFCRSVLRPPAVDAANNATTLGKLFTPICHDADSLRYYMGWSRQIVYSQTSLSGYCISGQPAYMDLICLIRSVHNVKYRNMEKWILSLSGYS